MTTASTVPNHIAIIPDGNRRWAAAQGLPASAGHKEGAKRFREVAEAAFNAGVKNVTIWGASEDNLAKRSPAEVQTLVRLLCEYLKQDIKSGHWKKGHVAFRMVGRWQKYLPHASLLDKLVREAEQCTADCEGCRLTILFGYDGQREMIDAADSLRKLDHPVNEKCLTKHLLTGFLPAVDLVIRTGGEPHNSAGFLMWQTANSQYYFTEQLWPDFTKQSLHAAIEDFSCRSRRFGS